MKYTALYESHKALGAKTGEFAGYEMPLYYDEGVLTEHEWVCKSCGLFDVSHMGQIMIEGTKNGSEVIDLIQKLTPANVEDLKIGCTRYSVLLNEDGGIIDDLMITKTGSNDIHLVINAGCKDKDIEWLKSNLPSNVTFTYFEDWALLALQGQKAEQVVRDILNIDLSDLPYMGLWAQDDYKMFISRLGYTGEDGFEISVPNDAAPELWNKLLTHDAVKPIGLAARDSLRLEMGYALYGHDIDASTSPVEANLNWIISKKTSGYLGYERIQKELSDGPSRLLVGLKLIDKGIAREGVKLENETGDEIGEITSGGHSPSSKSSIAQGYINPHYAQTGTKIFANVRGRKLEAEIVDRPFIPAKTKSMKKKAT